MGTIDKHNYEAFLLDYLEGHLSADLCSELKLFAITHPELEIDLDDQQLPTFAAEKLDADFKIHLKKTELNFPDEALINYIENNLSEAEKQVFEAKLIDDSELAKDLAQYKKTILPADTAFAFNHKNDLFKTEDDLFLNNRVIASVENLLSATDQTEFESELKANVILQKEFALVSKTRLRPDLSVIYPNKEALKKENRVFVLFNFRTVSAMAAAIALLLVFGLVFNNYTTKSNGNKSVAINKSQKIEPLKADVTHTVQALSGNDQKQFAKANTPVLIRNNKINYANNQRVNQVIVPGQSLQDPVANNKDLQNNQTPVEKEQLNPEKIKDAELLADHEVVKVSDEIPASIIADTESRHTLVSVLEVSEDDAEELTDTKNGFWKKAVKLAKRANHLGLRSVDGIEQPNQRFSLSFNAFSVERH